MNTVVSILQPPTAPDFVANPYIFYSRARALGDFVNWTDYKMTVATSHEAVNAVLTDPAMGGEAPMATRAFRPAHLSSYYRLDDHSLLRLEDPEHSRLRTAVVGALKDEIILTMAPTISQICDALIDSFPKGTPFDLQNAFADKVPGITLMRLLGFPDDMQDQVQRWARALDGMYMANRDRKHEDVAEQACIAFTEFMTSHLAKLRQRGGSDDLIGRLLDSQKTLVEEEIFALVLLIIRAGSGTAAYAIGNSIQLLLDHPERKLALAADQIEATVTECLRFALPLHLVVRHAQENVSLLGHHFPRNTKIGCLLASACHDDAVWPDGDRFDPFRAVHPHLGFGTGVHACIGKSLTHMMMKIALPALFSRCPNLRTVHTPVFANTYMFQRLERLDVQN